MTDRVSDERLAQWSAQLGGLKHGSDVLIGNITEMRSVITELQARRAAESNAVEALALAETIIRQLPQNGKNWDTVSRFWAAVSALTASKVQP